MATEPKTQVSRDEAYALRLTGMTGINVTQARDLISIFGHDLSSLVREARVLRKPL
jgi:predicted DNA-binding protein (UPF0251 family)